MKKNSSGSVDSILLCFCILEVGGRDETSANEFLVQIILKEREGV
jgi:hypothetical protein